MENRESERTNADEGQIERMVDSDGEDAEESIESNPDYRIREQLTYEALTDLGFEDAPIMAIDVEASGTDIARDMLLGFAVAHGSFDRSLSIYLDLTSVGFFSDFLGPNRTYIAHNAKYDRSMLKRARIVIDNFFDTMIAAHLLFEKDLSLKTLASKHLKMNIVSFTDLTKRIQDMTCEELAAYSCPHAVAALGLWGVFEPRLKDRGLWHLFQDIEMPLIPVLSDMELNGVTVDIDRLADLRNESHIRIELLIRALDLLSERPGMNYNSPAQVADLLYNHFKLPQGPRTPKGGKPSVSEDYLKLIVNMHPFIPLYLEYKGLQKLQSTYITGLTQRVVDGRIHCSFNQAGTETGRLSCSNPNLQNIPARDSEGRKIRTAFVAPPGCVLVKADYNQLELYVMACLSKCVSMIEAFVTGGDIHEQTAIRVYGNKKRRDEAKTLNYQIVYGGGDPRQRERFFEAYPEIRAWSNGAIKAARKTGRVRTAIGERARLIYPYYSASHNPSSIERGDREAVNTIIQGTAAEAVKIGMRKAWEAFRNTDVKMVLQVHDELIFEVPERQVADVAQTLHETLTYRELLIPLTVKISVGKNWGEMVDYTEK